MPIKEATYEQVAIEDPGGAWELVCGRLRSKPGMTAEHGYGTRELHLSLALQLDARAYTVSAGSARLRIASGTYYIPDLCVIPREFEQRKLRERPGRLEVYDEPLPLVVEVWSPSTGDYDVDEKLLEYQRRGGREIWRLHPYEKTLTAWRRQPDGSYSETRYRGGTVQPIALPAVTIELKSLFAQRSPRA